MNASGEGQPLYGVVWHGALPSLSPGAAHVQTMRIWTGRRRSGRRLRRLLHLSRPARPLAPQARCAALGQPWPFGDWHRPCPGRPWSTAPLLLITHQQGQVLIWSCRLPRPYRLRPFPKWRQNGRVRRCASSLATARQAARPGEDRGDRVGRGLLALLVLAVVARHRAVRGLRLDDTCHPASSAREVIRPSEPKPCATVSDCTSPS